ncbi:MAG: hypothetical protein IPP46_06125 [Bacteroidetes bacterium]|nr:hypothetical protein [Bacteroidota bacterium]
MENTIQEDDTSYFQGSTRGAVAVSVVFQKRLSLLNSKRVVAENIFTDSGPRRIPCLQ